MLPREIQVEHWPEKTQYDLPIRPLGWIHGLGVVPIILGVFFARMPLLMLRDMLHEANRQGGSHGFEWVMVAFVSVFVVASLLPVAFGVFVLWGRTRLVVGASRITRTEIAGPLRWSFSTPVADIQSLELRGAKGGSPDKPVPLGPGRLGVLMALRNRPQPSALLIGYPSDWVEVLAEEMRAQLRLKGTTVLVQRATAGTLESDFSKRPVLEKPSNSPVQIERSARGVRLVVPAEGFWRGSKGFGGFSIVWLLLTAAIGGAGVFGNNHSRGLLGAVLVLFLFLAIGVGILGLALQLGKRRWTLRADERCLSVEQSGPFGLKRWDWKREELAAVCVGCSNLEVNNTPMMELQVHCVGRGKVALLRYRPQAELAWIASELQQTLAVSGTPPEAVGRAAGGAKSRGRGA